MRILAIVQARQKSSRFSNKVLKKIGELSVVEIVHKRLSQSRFLDDIVYAIPNADTELKLFLKNKKIKVFCGSEDNVIQRYYYCAKKFNADVVVRITADCPLVDSRILDEMIELFIDKKLDYI